MSSSPIVRPLGEADLNDLMVIKPEEGLHQERFRDQAEGLIRYLGRVNITPMARLFGGFSTLPRCRRSQYDPVLLPPPP